MALKRKSLFLYGFDISSSNRSIDFKAVSGGPVLQATLTAGFYSLSDLMIEVARALNSADPHHTYTTSIDRTFVSGTENRVTITSTSSYFSLLFGTGPRIASSAAPILGYTSTDKTGATFYQSQRTAGTTLQPSMFGYNYLPQEMNQKVFGSLNISASGQKEAIVFQIQRFFQVQFKYEPEARVLNEWYPLMQWMIQQKPLEFTPDLNYPSTVYNCTLEKTKADGKGLGYDFKEMLPQFPFFYDTQLLTFRIKED
jgi:hypothetical protein